MARAPVAQEGWPPAAAAGLRRWKRMQRRAGMVQVTIQQHTLRTEGVGILVLGPLVTPCLCTCIFPPQLTSSGLDTSIRDDLERLKKIRNHRGLRHYWGLRVRGQHTKTTGRAGKTVGVAKKK